MVRWNDPQKDKQILQTVELYRQNGLPDKEAFEELAMKLFNDPKKAASIQGRYYSLPGHVTRAMFIAANSNLPVEESSIYRSHINKDETLSKRCKNLTREVAVLKSRLLTAQNEIQRLKNQEPVTEDKDPVQWAIEILRKYGYTGTLTAPSTPITL